MKSLPVTEFFLSRQGEGPSVGKPAFFLRVWGCDLRCPWCDTSYSWTNPKHSQPYSASELLVSIPAAPILVVVTGGEPLLYQTVLASLFDKLDNPIEIETAGHHPPSEALLTNERVSFNVSPKLAHSGLPKAQRITEALRVFADHPRTTFKFVVAQLDDLSEVHEIAIQFGIPSDRIWLMPLGATPEAYHQTLSIFWDWPSQPNLRYRISPRLHLGGFR